MARLDWAIQPPRVRAANESYDRLDGPLWRAMTCFDSVQYETALGRQKRAFRRTSLLLDSGA
jgi:hypothetical protein